MKIAAYLDAQGVPTSLYRAGCLHVFEAIDDGESHRWQSCAKHYFSIDASMTLELVKNAIRLLAEAVGSDCRVLLACDVRGMAYSVLQEEYGFRTWQSDGLLVQQLDYVHQRELEMQAQKKYDLVLLNNQQVPAPMLTRGGLPGHYWIDLRAALKHPSNPTSRNVLIPFLSAGRFVRLEILCGHLPKWMAWEFERLNLAAETEEVLDVAGDVIRVIVYSRHFPEGWARKPGLLGGSPSAGQACPREMQRLPSAGGRVIDMPFRQLLAPQKG